MKRTHFLCIFLLAVTVPVMAADFRNAQALRKAMLEKETQRWSSIEAGQGLILCKQLMGNRAVAFEEAVRKDGAVQFVHQVSPLEMQQRLESAAGIDPHQKHEFAKHYAEGLDKLYQGLASETGGADMRTLMGMQGAGDFLMAAAPSPEELARMRREREADKQRQFADLDMFFDNAKIVGSETVEGRATYHLRSNSSGMQKQQDKDFEFEPQSADVWIDKEELVLVKLKTVGKLTSDGSTRKMTVEQINSDFKKKGPLFVPHHQVSRMGGVLSPKEQKQMQEAQKEMAKFKKQLESMPPGQQNMIRQMMGSKLEQFEKMASSGAIEMETIVDKASIGGIKEYSFMMANYAARIPINQLPADMNPFGQQP